MKKSINHLTAICGTKNPHPHKSAFKGWGLKVIMIGKGKRLSLVKILNLFSVFLHDKGSLQLHRLGQHSVIHREIFRDEQILLRHFISAIGLAQIIRYFLGQIIRERFVLKRLFERAFKAV